jgi:methionyl-tRNA formyltransferase
MKILILTDNEFIYENLNEIINDGIYQKDDFYFFYSPNNLKFKEKYKDISFTALSIKDNLNEIINKYDMIFSLHCKQIFPEKLVTAMRCINIHPGFNPFNRGYYPQVYSILNKLPVGVTIHEMDALLDHGPVILQEQVIIDPWDTSYDVYKKIQLKEVELLSNNLRNIIDNNYTALAVPEGNLNMKKDFDNLCEIDLNKMVTFREAIDFLRAMTFNGYRNSYYTDDQGHKIYVEIKLDKAD